MANQDISSPFGYANQVNNTSNATYLIGTKLDGEGIRDLQYYDISSGKFYSAAKNTLHLYSSDVFGSVYGGENDYQKLDPLDRYYLNTPYLKNAYKFLTSTDPYGDAVRAGPEAMAITAEKARIAAQKVSRDYSREDHFAIGTVYLRIPPTQINVSEDAHHYRFSTLRSPGETVFTSGRTTTRIELDIVFTGLDEINDKLKPLIAQFKTTPYLPIESDYLKSILNPYNSQLVDKNFLKNLKYQKRELENRSAQVDKLLKYADQEKKYGDTILNRLDRIGRYIPNYTDPNVRETLRYRIQNPSSIPPQDIGANEIVITQFGTQRVDLGKWIKKQIKVQGNNNIDFVTVDRDLNEISAVQNEIDSVQKKMNDFGDELKDERFSDRQLAVVLSQISLSVAPGFPDTIQCHLSLYSFTYDPFSLDFAFISGYKKDAATPDITKCDFFIDWYSKRFLAARNDPEKPSLKQYYGDSNIVFSYFKNLTPVTKKITSEDLKRLVQVQLLQIGGEKEGKGIYPTGITVSIKNILQFLPLLSSKNPTCQYMGSMNSDVIMNFECTDQTKLNEFCKMIHRIRSLSRSMNRATRTNFVYVENDLLQFLGMQYFMIGDLTVDTVPGNPGLYSVSLGLVEHKVGQQRLSKLQREGVLAEGDVERAALYILDQANAGNKVYQDIVLNQETGWFKKQNNIVQGFMTGIGSGARNEVLRQSILNKAPSVKVVDKLVSVFNRQTQNELRQSISAHDSMTGGASAATTTRSVRTAAGVFSGSVNLGMTISGEYGSSIELKDWSGVSEEMGIIIGDPEFSELYDTQRETISRVAAVMDRGRIVDMIYDPKFSDLNAVLNERRSKDTIDTGVVYAYPDLDLPTYSDLPNGFRIKNTNKEAGLPRGYGEDDDTIQSDNAQVDPDFYFYKGSLWQTVDDDHPATISVDSGIDVYKRIAHSNKGYRRSGAPDESELASFLSAKRQAELGNKQFDDRKSTMTSEETRKLGWVDLTNIRIYDGDSITATSNGKDVTWRLDGIDAPEKKDSPDGTKKADPVNADKATKLLRKILRGGIVKGSATGEKDYGRTIGSIWVSHDGGQNFKNVSTMMLNSGGNKYNIRPWINSSNPLSVDYEQAFLHSHENFVYNLISKPKGPAATAYKILKDATLGGMSLWMNPGNIASAASNTAAGLGADVGKLIGVVGGAAVNILGGNKQTANSVAITEVGAVLGSIESALIRLVGNTAPVNLESWLTNDPDRLIAQKLTTDAKTPNNNFNRFDRESEREIDRISNKIRESQKDDVLRMSRAFPTFKFYFMEEDMPDWGRLDDFYSYQAINSINITKSRTEAADVAVISLMNTEGTLDRSEFGLHDEDNMFILRGSQESNAIADQETKKEQTIEEFILKPGTIIKIKMGYSSDPKLLDDVFIGMVSDVSGGDMINIVAQGYGVELLHNVAKPMYWETVASSFKVLNQIITSPEVAHFGKVEWLPEESGQTVKVHRRSVYDPDKNEYVGASSWRNIKGIRCLLSLRDDQRDNNIWVPENSWLYNMSQGGYQTIITQNKTIWDVFREMQRRMPGYITTVLPFDNRATIYFGPAEFLYYYTNQKRVAEGKWRADRKADYSQTDEQKIQDQIDQYGCFELKPEEFQKDLDLAASFYNQQRNGADVSSEWKNRFDSAVASINFNGSKGKMSIDDKNLAAGVSAAIGANIAAGNTSGLNVASWLGSYYGYNIGSSVAARGFFETGVGALSKGTDTDRKIASITQFLSSHMDEASGQLFNASSSVDSSGKRLSSFVYQSKEPVYVNKWMQLKTRAELLEDWKVKKEGEWSASEPRRKLVRQYHFKDSIHHIISNSIVANDSYMYNKVTVEFGNEISWKARAFLEGTPAFGKVSAQVDDDLWPEKIKERVVQERNAREIVTAWNYALGNLSEDFRKMYSGHLTILGDASIKPYDIIMFSDYFTDMHGPIEVEQVTHHFSSETGFITTIVPNLVCHVNNALQQGSLTVAGAYMDSTTKLVQSIRTLSTGGLPIPILGNAVANVAFWMTGLSQGRREPIAFTPLAYAGRPYIAGIEGLRPTSLVEAIRGKVTRFILQKERIFEAVENSWDYLRRYIYEREGNIKS